MTAETSSNSVLAEFQHAVALHRAGQLAEAKNRYESLLRLSPESPQLLTALATLALQMGQAAVAVDLFDRSLVREHRQSDALVNRGSALIRLGRLDEALSSFDQAVALNPNHPAIHLGRGNVLRNLKRLDEALASFDRALALSPEYAEAYLNRGNVLRDLKRLEDALESYERAAKIRPEHPVMHLNLGNALRDLKRLNEALVSYDRAIAIDLQYVDAHINRGIALKDLGRLDEAMICFDYAIGLNPNNADIYLNRGSTFRDLRRPDEALRCFDHALSLNADDSNVYNNRGHALVDLKRFDEALASFAQAAELEPNGAEAYYHRGNALRDMKRLEEAQASLDHAIKLDPGFVEAHWNMSLLKLLEGAYEEGWALYEWRWQREEGSASKHSASKCSQPKWLGDQEISGKTLLIRAEQGLGDVIQFCRYAPMVEALGAHVILEAPAPLVALLATLPGKFTVVEQRSRLPAFDLHCPIMSLPLAFGTTLATVPASVPYLHAVPDKSAIWRRRLGIGTRLRVGLVWSGSPDHKNDHNRSIPLEILAPLLELPAEFHSLQKEYRQEDERVLAELEQIGQHQGELQDFSDTAALLSQMDLVIAVDTSVAHLSGALARKTWVLLPYSPDFRWMLDRNDSPWYPTMTLFRQTACGDWAGVVAEVAERLRETLQPGLAG
jgi:hypothetical protein